MKRWQKIVGVIVFGTIVICLGCSRSIDYCDGEKVSFSDLPKEVQDTLIWWEEHTTISIEDTVIVELDDVICFESDICNIMNTKGTMTVSQNQRINLYLYGLISHIWKGKSY